MREERLCCILRFFFQHPACFFSDGKRSEISKNLYLHQICQQKRKKEKKRCFSFLFVTRQKAPQTTNVTEKQDGGGGGASFNFESMESLDVASSNSIKSVCHSDQLFPPPPPFARSASGVGGIDLLPVKSAATVWRSE